MVKFLLRNLSTPVWQRPFRLAAARCDRSRATASRELKACYMIAKRPIHVYKQRLSMVPTAGGPAVRRGGDNVRGQYIRYPCEAHGQRRRHVTPPITRSRQPPQGQPSFSS